MEWGLLLLTCLRWTFVDEADPVVSAIRSIRDLFPNVRFKCEPDTTLKVREGVYMYLPK